MKLELKHLAPYLPYGLKMIHDFEKVRESRNKPLKPFITTLEGTEFVYWRTNEIHKYRFKPILRPLSDLTKEINNEKHTINFIPIEVLQLHNNVKIDADGLVTDGKDEYGINWLSYESFQLLLQWHFDVFGLIEKGLAIDINTLK
jgi:hypothetical protein